MTLDQINTIIYQPVERVPIIAEATGRGDYRSRGLTNHGIYVIL